MFTAHDSLPAETAVGGVTLDVADVDAQTAFYRDVLLLDVLADRGATVELGRGADTLVTLRHRPDLPRGVRRSAGLYHTALLHPDAAALATTLASVAVHAPGLYTGAGDHLVSRAFYLDDPEGNGVELYVDRPRDQWRWQGGQVAMATLAIDPHAFLDEHLTDAARDFVAGDPGRRGTLGDARVVGHVHLKVGDTARARDFYVDGLGFDVTAEVRGALFVSAGGYHHHLAMNTWESAGAGLRAPALGLGRVHVLLPDADAVARVAGRLRARGLDVRDDGVAVEVDDPWRNLVRLSVGGLT